MPKRIGGKWKCVKCGFEADGATWNNRLLREGDWGKAWYSCPGCNKEVELRR
jgi:hypothetical protein